MKTKHVVPISGGESASAQGRMNSSHHILVVDDDVDIRLLNAEVLKYSGYEVDVAEDGVAGWEALRANGYDLLITDHDMPKLTGVELLEKLRAAHMTLPVIMATGTLPEQELTRSPWLQPAVMLPKPYTIDELLDTVKKVLPANGSTSRHIAAMASEQSQPSTDGARP